MSEQLTIEVSDRIVHQAEHTSAKTSRPIEQVIADWLEHTVKEMPVDDLSDDELLSLTKLQLSPEKQSRYSRLLVKNREGQLDEKDRCELDSLMRSYEHGLLRKAQALRSAVQRGLIKPLN